MAYDLRELLSDIVSDVMVLDASPDAVVAALLDDPRVAVLVLPKLVSSRNRGGDRIAYVEHGDTYVERSGVVRYVGPTQFHAREGDDPAPIAAALIAAYRDAVKTSA